VNLATPATFYFPGKPVAYRVSVSDKEDGTLESGADKNNVSVKSDFVSGTEKAQVVGHQIISDLTIGRNMTQTMDCKTCHKEADKSIGPAFQLVSEKYKTDPAARDKLVRKVINGGAGVWGQREMAAHPDLKIVDAQKIVDWVLSLARSSTVKVLPIQGEVLPTVEDVKSGKALQISAAYMDKGGNGIKSLGGAAVATLRSPNIDLAENDGKGRFDIDDYKGRHTASPTGDNAWLRFNDLILSNVVSVAVGYGFEEPLVKGYVVEIHADGLDGELLGEGKIPAGGKPMALNTIIVPLKPAGDKPRTIFVLWKKADPAETKEAALTGLTFTAK